MHYIKFEGKDVYEIRWMNTYGTQIVTIVAKEGWAEALVKELEEEK